MKVLHLTTHLNIGGITSYVNTLCTGLKELGILSSIAASPGEMNNQFEKAGIPFYPIPLLTKNFLSPRVFKSWLILKKLFSKEKWDIIHANTRVSQTLAHFLSKSTRIPYVTTFHGHYDYKLERKIFPCLGNFSIAISIPVETDLKRQYPHRTSQIKTVFHGIDIHYFNPTSISLFQKQKLREKFGLKNVKTLGYVGRLSAEKGHLRLLNMISYLRYYCKDFQLLIVGNGREKKQILETIKTMKLEEFVTILPAQKDPREILS